MPHALLAVCKQVATINLVRRQELCVMSTLRAPIITRLHNRCGFNLRYYRGTVPEILS